MVRPAFETYSWAKLKTIYFQTCNVKDFLDKSWFTISCSGAVKSIENKDKNEDFFQRIGCFKSNERQNILSCDGHFASMTEDFKSKFIHHPTCFGKVHVGGRRIQPKGRSTTNLTKSKEILYYVGDLLPPGTFLCTPCNFYYGNKLKTEKKAAMEVDSNSEDDANDDNMDLDPDFDPENNNPDDGNESKKSKMDTDTIQVACDAMDLLRKLTNLKGFDVSTYQ